MENVHNFFENKCESYNEHTVLLPTDFEKVEININDNTFKDIRYLNIENVVRFLNPKIDLRMYTNPPIPDEELPIEDFDNVLEFLKDQEDKKEPDDLTDDLKKLFFLPSHIEFVIKQITRAGQKNKIDARLKRILPETFINERELNFKPEVDLETVSYHLRAKHSLSFYKFFDTENKTPCDKNATEVKINEVKYKLNVEFIESFEHYFIGDITFEAGLIERDINQSCDNPLYYHFNFWKLQSSDLLDIIKEFEVYPFSKEVIMK